MHAPSMSQNHFQLCGDGRYHRGSKDSGVVQEPTAYRGRAEINANWNDQYEQNSARVRPDFKGGY